MLNFQFLNDKIHNYGFFFDIIVNFIIQKLKRKQKSKRTSLKKYTN